MIVTGYDKKYYNDILGMVQNTWEFHKLFPEIKNKYKLYKMITDALIISCTYIRIVVDENNKACGLIAGFVNREKNFKFKFKEKLRLSKVVISGINQFLTNNFGSKKYVKNTTKEFLEVFKKLGKDLDKFDANVNLFVMSSAHRGRGIGKKLMNEFIEHCKKFDVKTVGLYTDRGCTFEFYDRYGYKLHESGHSRLLPKPEYEKNAFIYRYDIV